MNVITKNVMPSIRDANISESIQISNSVLNLVDNNFMKIGSVDVDQINTLR
jgi:hypothetical protein